MRRHCNLGRGYGRFAQAPPEIVIQLVLAVERPDCEFRGGAAPAVNTNCPATANPVIACESPAAFSAAFQEVIHKPSEEYFSMRPVFAYATNTEPSCAVAMADGRSSADGAFCGTSHDFTKRPRPSNFTTREPAGSGT